MCEKNMACVRMKGARTFLWVNRRSGKEKLWVHLSLAQLDSCRFSPSSYICLSLICKI